ncbi:MULTISPECIES: PG0541 family transporter-associated protein [Porphyromonas]|uniref:Nitrogen regulatory protein P-II family n=1 Tax=Porphyromonas canoris TaxID=36875 RepID=A0ABR4XK62_9PORP|nr:MULTISPECIES: PG0541 family transporter-associated protein [Porphyromonas]KGL52395.1 hypothetical protein HQ29_05610 [Porphyromonas canoris]KGN70541.1 hypothetical protein JT26_03515 [Porphyromonas sp. COT-108 OH1349]KGN92059.1 hypothetical protein HQ43_08425 [Porphyromonas canoris]KGN96086.1 hypothetical protein HQ39_03820 [Porphyromonas sp. COT-108 OH2963]
MKAVFISFNQAYFEFIKDILDKLHLKGFTYWEEVRGEGSRTGEPHMGTHAWPTLNGALLVMVSETKVSPLLDALHALDKRAEQQGLRAFVWNIEQTI